MRVFDKAVRLRGWLALCVGLIAFPAAASETTTVRVGVLQYGTVGWELEVMQREGLAEREGVKLVIVPMALNDAVNVAIQGGAVDIIVNDWIWVSRQRSEGRDFVFSPYSLAVGGVMVRPDAGVTTYADLQGKRLGIAGGALDKSWLLLRAYSRRMVGADAAQFVRTAFAAPPLLNQLMLRGELPAVLNFWHFNARLRAAGMQPLLTLDEMLQELGVGERMPMIGWVFRESWAAANRAGVEGFLRASKAAKQRMLESDAVWEALRASMRVDDEATFEALREGFRAGIPGPSHDVAAAEAVARQVFAILAAEGGQALVGKADALAPGTFWSSGAYR
jgi:NitT/TauT family transport system substrate-binding protein